MIPVALILLGLVLLFSVAVVVSNPVPVTLSIFGAQIPLQTPAVYFTGAGAMLVVIVALGMLRIGLRRSMARRKELRALKKEANTQGQVAGSGRAADAGRPDSASAAAGSVTGVGAGGASGTAVPAGGSSRDSAPAGSTSRDTAAAGTSGSSVPTGRADAPGPAGAGSASSTSSRAASAATGPTASSGSTPTGAGPGGPGAAPAGRSAEPGQHGTTAAQREAWLAEVDDLTRDEPPR